MGKRIHFIINPASGHPFPILHTINNVCSKYDCHWTVDVTKKDNTSQLAQQAVQTDADIIAVYGGDGTIAQVANSLINTDKVLGILPGGTANVLSVELGIPQDIRQACVMICKGGANVREIDVGEVNDKHFLLRVGLGFEAEAVKAADRTFKDRLGVLAYALSGLKALLKTKMTEYELVLDGEMHSRRGVSLVVANSGNLGLPGVSLLPKINITDGYLDVILIRSADLQKLFDSKDSSISKKMSLFEHWRAKDISIKFSPKQSVHYDGEVLDQDEIQVHIIPKAVKIICK